MTIRDIRRRQFEAGKADGKAGKPPADLRRAYLEGYEEGREGKPIVRGPRNCPHCGEVITE